MFANIIIDITHEKLDKIFQYRIPSELEGMLEVGAEVEVPFGRGNRLTKGYIIGFSETCDYDLSKVKDWQKKAWGARKSWWRWQPGLRNTTAAPLFRH